MRRVLVIAMLGITAFGAYRFEWLGIESGTPFQVRYGYDKPGESDRHYYGQRVYPYRSAPDGWRTNALAHLDAMQARQMHKTAGQSWRWISVGPVNIAGRIRALALDPFDANILYAGSAGGGVWKSPDGGLSWTPLDDLMPNLRIGSIAVSPHNRNLILAGNGEGYVFWQGAFAYGRGVYRSSDAGAVWELIPSTDNSDFEFVFDVAFDPWQPGAVLATTKTGIHRSTNNGESWTSVLSSTNKRGCMAVFSRTQQGIVYGAIEGLGIFKSSNAGVEWKSITNSDVDLPAYNRIYLAPAPGNGNILYAAFTAVDMSCAGILRTSNGGASWTEMAIPRSMFSGESYMGQQGMYNSVLAVHPQNPNIIYAGGIDLYKSVNGGASWTQISNWYTRPGMPYVHADQHAIAFHHQNPDFLYIANDGGITVTPDGGDTFAGRNTGLITTQLHSGTPHPHSDVVLAGTIDNGNLKVASGAKWEEVTGGDGGFTAINYNNPAIMYTELYYLHIMKSTRSGAPGSFEVSMSGIPRSGGFGTSDRVSFIAPFIMDPNNPDVLYAGSYRVFKTSDGAANWIPISEDLSEGSALSALAVSKANGQVLYTGSVNGRCFITTNGGSAWNYRSTGLPGRYITDIEIHPDDPATAYISVSGFNRGHAFMTTNAGNLWHNISGSGASGLPNVPANTVALHPENDSVLFIGTDVGLFYSEDAGATWQSDNNGIGNVVIADLQFRRDGVLYAATHGRGQYRSDASLFANGPPAPSDYRVQQNYPNPSQNGATYIAYELPMETTVTFSLHNAAGRLVREYNQGVQAPGRYSLGVETAGLAAGFYFYTFTPGTGLPATRKMLVMH